MLLQIDNRSSKGSGGGRAASAPRRRVFALIVSGLLFVVFVAVTSVSAHAAGCSDPAARTGAAGQVSQAGRSAGLRVHVNPDTGELLEEPPPDSLPEPAPEKPLAEPDIVVEQQPDGTVVADVGDRFMTELRIEIIDGEVVTCHRPGADPGAVQHTRTEGAPDGDDD